MLPAAAYDIISCRLCDAAGISCCSYCQPWCVPPHAFRRLCLTGGPAGLSWVGMPYIAVLQPVRRALGTGVAEPSSLPAAHRGVGQKAGRQGYGTHSYGYGCCCRLLMLVLVLVLVLLLLLLGPVCDGGRTGRRTGTRTRTRTCPRAGFSNFSLPRSKLFMCNALCISHQPSSSSIHMIGDSSKSVAAFDHISSESDVILSSLRLSVRVSSRVLLSNSTRASTPSSPDCPRLDPSREPRFGCPHRGPPFAVARRRRCYSNQAPSPRRVNTPLRSRIAHPSSTMVALNGLPPSFASSSFLPLHPVSLSCPLLDEDWRFVLHPIISQQ